MDPLDRLVLLAELEHEYCGLNHGKGDTKKHKAHDYIILPFGKKDKKGKVKDAKELVIPVCRECIEALQGNEWTLLYCFDCNSSRWVLREAAKNKYRHHILWLRGCPDCSNQFGGLYFSEDGVAEDNILLSKLKIRNAA